MSNDKARVPPGKVLRFSDSLDHAVRAGARLRKGERTRLRLKWAAAVVLERNGYLNMRVADICKLAKVSSATLYLYYKNTSEITLEILGEFLQAAGRLAGGKGPHGDAFEAILHATQEMVEFFAANAGLMRCLIQISDEVPEFAELWRTSSDAWYRRIAQSVARRTRAGAHNDDVVLFAVYAVGGMVDQLLRDLFVLRNPALEELRARLAPTSRELSELLSILWYRALYGANPSSASIERGNRLLNLQLRR
jgi:TetR/AcrR family transcriptional repressor of nem operon